MNKEYDIIVVGGGHSGCEAASIAANLGKSTAYHNEYADNWPNVM